jgi:hypothetical protein
MGKRFVLAPNTPVCLDEEKPVNAKNKLRAVPAHRQLALAVATASLLGLSALPAKAQFYDYSGSVYTYPFDFFPIDPSVSFYDMTGNGLFVGFAAPGSFSMFAGARLNADYVSIGGGGTGGGSVSVSGASTRLEFGNTAGSRLHIGEWGTGSMVVSAGAVVDAALPAGACVGGAAFWCNSVIGNGAGSTGTLTVTGSGSEVRAMRYFGVGQAHVQSGFGTPGGTTNATVNVLEGGTLRTEQASVGNGPSGPDALGTEKVFATVTIDGAGSRWIVTRNSVDNGTAFFGAGTHANAQATINITNAGKLIVDGTGSIGPFDGLQLANNGSRADLTVSGVGSAVEVINSANSFINVGRGGATGQGSFSVLAGATASAMFLNVGRDGARGDLLIDGAGSKVTLSGVGTPGIAGAAGTSIGWDGGTGFATVSNGGRWLITDGGADSRPNASSPGMSIGRGTGGTGSLLITGAGSTVEIVSTSLGLGSGVADNFNPYMAVGRDSGSFGELTVSDGGKLLMTGNAKTSLTDQRYTSLRIGDNSGTAAGGVGRATITGLGSEVRVVGTDAFVSVGNGPGSIGDLSVLNKGHLESKAVLVGWTGGGGTMTVDNATVRISGGPYVDGSAPGLVVGAGAGSVGALSLKNGARVSLSSDTSGFGLTIGGSSNQTGGTGVMTMAGGSAVDFSDTADHALSVGRRAGGVGFLTMTEGSSITLGSNGSTYIGRELGATGTMFMQGGSTLSAGYVGIGSTPGVDTGTGILIVSDNSTVTATTVEIGARGLLGGNGGTINGDVIVGGTLSPGESPGKIRINGGVTPRVGGTLVLDVATTGGDSFAAVARGFISPLGELTPGYDIDQLVIGSGSAFGFAGLTVVMNFLGTTDPTAFADSGGLDLDNFMRSASGDAESGLSTVFAPGVHWTDVLAEATVVARSEVADYEGIVLEFTGSSVGITAIVTSVPEPSSWALTLLGLWLLTTVVRRRRQVARRR